MIAIFLLAFTLSLFSFGTTPAAAGDVAGVSTHLFLTVLRDYDHDASFSVTYTDALEALSCRHGSDGVVPRDHHLHQPPCPRLEH